MYSLKTYASRNELNNIIACNMADVIELNGDGKFEQRACQCFEKAYEICGCMLSDYPVALWKLPDYYNIATYDIKKYELNLVMKAATLTIVTIFAQHFDERKKPDKQIIDKIVDYVKGLTLPGETFKVGGMEIMAPLVTVTTCNTVYKTLCRNTDIDYVIPLVEFPMKLAPLEEVWPLVQTGGNDSDSSNVLDDTNEKIQYEIISLKTENERLKAENDQLKSEIDNLKKEKTETKWISCFDSFLHPSLNAEAIADALKRLSSPHLPKNERGFWWVFYKVATDINWIPQRNHKVCLQWVNLHFDCGWDWTKDQQFKFSDINEKIKSKPVSEWNRSTTGNIIGDYYGELYKIMFNTFVENVESKLFDKSAFIKTGCTRINNGRK